MEDRASKRRMLFSEDHALESDSSDASGGVALNVQSTYTASSLPINEDFARKYEHNQRRAEIQRCRVCLHFDELRTLTSK